MNQILQTITNNKKSELTKLKKVLRFQLYISIFLIITVIYFITSHTLNLYKKEQYSSEILNNYNITKLYSNLGNITNLNSTTEDSYILGIIEIPKINIYYPIFSNYNDELLKISPCRFYGTQPGKKGNLCIAGHNYDNDKFFSKIINLDIDDEIIIYDNSNKKFFYYVFNIYEVNPNDLSPIYSYDKNSKILTLITCNNSNNNRIIIKAIDK